MFNNELLDEGISLRLETSSLYIVSSICQPLPETGEKKTDSKTHDLCITIQVDKLGKAFRDFAKQSGRLSRLAQRKKKVRIPSEGFNQLLAQRVEKVERSFLLYMRLKEELLAYIKATARRNDCFPDLEVARYANKVEPTVREDDTLPRLLTFRIQNHPERVRFNHEAEDLRSISSKTDLMPRSLSRGLAACPKDTSS